MYSLCFSEMLDTEIGDQSRLGSSRETCRDTNAVEVTCLSPVVVISEPFASVGVSMNQGKYCAVACSCSQRLNKQSLFKPT